MVCPGGGLSTPETNDTSVSPGRRALQTHRVSFIISRMSDRNYESIIAIARGAAGDRRQRMQTIVDAFWAGLATQGVSWIGFYLHETENELTLGPRRDKPACSPIGMHGACGRAFLARRGLIVRDVRSLGASYVACDPRDLAELVIPLFDDDGVCWGVLDADSFDIDAFDLNDLRGMEQVVLSAKLTSRRLSDGEIDTV